MRLETALYTSREGLNAHGQAIGVIGDNIANVNTVGFKASRSEFADLVSDGAEGHESYAVPGGGNGVEVAKIRTIQDTGVIEFTGRSLDVAIAGRGFFMTGDPANPDYTRAGNFEMNDEGLLVDSRGQPVLGTSGDAAAGTSLSTLDLLGVDLSGAQTTKATLSGNLNAAEGFATPPVTAPATFNELTAAATTSAAFTVNDSLGGEHNVTLAYFKTANNTWTAQAYMDGADSGGTPGQPVLLGSTTMIFGSDGIIADANKATAQIAASATYANGAAAQNFTIDMAGFSQYATNSVLSGVSQDGQGTGEIKSYEFKKDGRLVAILSSGSEISVGTVQLADFTNVDDLSRAGNNLYATGENSGAKDPGSPGKGGLGTLEGSSLERSTVDLASQFVDLTLYQRGYQANSQILNAASTLIHDTIGLIR
jgi:flagellar hook protein FlgE